MKWQELYFLIVWDRTKDGIVFLALIVTGESPVSFNYDFIVFLNKRRFLTPEKESTFNYLWLPINMEGRKSPSLSHDNNALAPEITEGF